MQSRGEGVWNNHPWQSGLPLERALHAVDTTRRNAFGLSPTGYENRICPRITQLWQGMVMAAMEGMEAIHHASTRREVIRQMLQTDDPIRIAPVQRYPIIQR